MRSLANQAYLLQSIAKYGMRAHSFFVAIEVTPAVRCWNLNWGRASNSCTEITV
jgi:hypothetical protein